MSRRLVFLALAAFVASATAAAAACPVGQFYLDLKNCTSAGLTGVSFLSACAPVGAAKGCPAAAGWKRAVVRIDLPTDCTQANVVVEYEGLPKGWTVNLGDSPTDDGFAGDAGTTPNNAELWILEENLSVANGSGNAAEIDNPLASAHLALTDGAVKLVVKNQFVSWGNPYAFVQAPANKNLFAIPDTAVAAEGRKVYLGLNQVITGRSDRRGCGARRALVTYK